MFKEMRDALSIPQGVDILEYTRSLSDEPDSLSPTASSSTSSNPSSSPRSLALSTIQQIERNAMSSQTPQPGLIELMTYLSSHSIRKALCTRNFPAPVHHLLEKYLPTHTFWPVVTRETEGVSKPKPSPEGIWWIARAWKLDQDGDGEQDDGGGGDNGVDNGNSNDNTSASPAQRASDEERRHRSLGATGLIMVGDSIDDLAAGHHAGAATVLLVNKGENEHLREHEYADLAVERLDELIGVLEGGFVGRGGGGGM